MAKKRLAPTVTSPAKMGEEMAHPQANSAQSPRLQYAKRGNSKGGQDPATANHRSGHQERLGAKWAPQMLMSSPQAPEAAQTQRNVRTVQSAVGNRDFWLKRQYGQRLQ